MRSECVQSVFRVHSVCVQSVFRVCSILMSFHHLAHLVCQFLAFFSQGWVLGSCLAKDKSSQELHCSDQRLHPIVSTCAVFKDKRDFDNEDGDIRR